MRKHNGVHISSMSDEELLSFFRTKRCALTTTDLEDELAERLERALDNIEDTDGLKGQVEQLEEDKDELEDRLADLKSYIETIKEKLE